MLSNDCIILRGQFAGVEDALGLLKGRIDLVLVAAEHLSEQLELGTALYGVLLLFLAAVVELMQHLINSGLG